MSRESWALRWANGLTFGEIYDLMREEIVNELADSLLLADPELQESLEQLRRGEVEVAE